MEPLAQLKDIHLPENIPQYPIAIGWWILLGAAILLCIWALIKYKRYRALRKNKKIALKTLEQCANNQDIVAIMKWAALQYFPRKDIAQLFGDSFQQFLYTHLPIKYQPEFNQLCYFNNNEVILDSVYKSEQHQAPTESTKKLASFWLTNALPPKKDKQAEYRKTISEAPAIENTSAASNSAVKTGAEND